MENKILLVDDEKDIVALMEEALQKDGFHQIEKAHTGADALKIFRDFQPDVIVLDIMLPLLLDGKKMGAYKKRLSQILEVVGLSDRRRHTPRELSGGQQQRVAIARALIGKPEILFADEPTGNLDSKTGAEIINLLREINQSIGQTIIMVTHSPEAARSSSRMITVQDGTIL